MNMEKISFKYIHLIDDKVIHLPPVKYMSHTAISILQKNYESIVVELAEDRDSSFMLSVDKLGEDERIDLMLDLEFFYRNPDLPLENLCSHFHNYHPHNLTQEELLKHASGLLSLASRSAAGLFIYGSPGVGKTHIAVGIAKEFLKRGVNPNYINLQPHYLNFHRYILNENDQTYFIPNQVWLIDDLNSPFTAAMKIFKMIVLNVHNYGGRIFVTSNVAYDYLMANGFAADPGERERFIDRAKGIFAVLQIDGDSQRAKNAWYNKI